MVRGKGVEVFRDEAGGHRFQRIPPTEKRGRVQTSTVTVALLDTDRRVPELKESDCEFKVARGSGPGGQARNKTESCVTVLHRPTGLSARADMRSQHQSKATALAVLAARVAEQQGNREAAAQNALRKQQVGSGMRGCKRRTLRERDNQVKDHVTGKTWTYKAWMRGDW